MKNGKIKNALKKISIATLPVLLTFTLASSSMQNVTLTDTGIDDIINQQIQSTEKVESPVVDNQQTQLNEKLDKPIVDNEQTTNTEQEIIIPDETQKEEVDTEDQEVVEEETNVNLDYASMEQVYSLMADLNADNSYFRTYQNFADIRKPDVFNVLNHNGGEPIYIVISDDFDEESKKLITQAVDTVFGIVSQINDKYTYQVVDKAPKGKCSIQYRILDVNVGGYAWYDFEYKTIRSRGGVVTLDTSIVNKKETQNDLLYTSTHELLHIFGFRDVYNNSDSKFVGQRYSKTFMTTTFFLSTSTEFVPISPNDYKLLLSAYAPQATTEEEYKETLNKIDNLATAYETEYYKRSVDFVESKMKDYQVAEFADTFVIGFENFLYSGSKVAIKVDGNKYSLFVKGEDGTKTKVHEGNVYHSGKGLILQDLKMENAFNYGKYEGELFTGDFVLGCGVKDGEVKVFVCNYSETIFQDNVIVSGFEHLQQNSLEY